MMHSFVELVQLPGTVATFSAPAIPKGFPEPVTLESVSADIGTAPTGATLIFEVSVEPAGTVITTGTFALTETEATLTAFDPVSIPEASWIEVQVTQVGSTEPGEELCVMGKVSFDH